MLDIIAKILKEEADKNRHLATHGGVSKGAAYCTIEEVEGVLIVVFREPIPYEGDMETNLGHLEDFIKQYSK